MNLIDIDLTLIVNIFLYNYIYIYNIIILIEVVPLLITEQLTKYIMWYLKITFLKHMEDQYYFLKHIQTL